MQEKWLKVISLINIHKQQKKKREKIFNIKFLIVNVDDDK